jgi:hypothetical protein
MLAGGFDNITFKGTSGITTYKAAIIVKDDGSGGYDIDTTFVWAAAPTTAPRVVFDILEKPDLKFIFVGNISTTYIRGVTATGATDTTFAVGTGFTTGTTTSPFIRARAMTLFESGSFVYVGGSLTGYQGGAVDQGICRLDKTTAARDASFNPSVGVAGGTLSTVNQIGPLINNTSGSFFMYGDFTTYDGATVNYIAQPSATGSIYVKV